MAFIPTASSLQGQPVSQIGLGVVTVYPGQQDKYCGVQACVAFQDMLINVLDPKRYAKVALIGAATAGAALVFAPQTKIAFADSIGAVAANTGFPFALTKAETDYQESENPVPQNGGFLFCAVGMTVAAERMFATAVDGADKTYPEWISQAADYRENVKEDVYDNTWLSISYGNNGCTYDIGLAKHFPTPNSPAGGDVLSPGRIAMPLSFTPFNAVVCIDSLRNNRRAVLNVNFEHGFSEAQTSLTLTTVTAYQPIEFALFGFIIQLPGAGDLYQSMVSQIPG